MVKIYDSNIHSIEKVEEGILNGYRWLILSIQGSHPCAYVVVDRGHPLYEYDCFMDELQDIVHGGITFSESYLKGFISEDENKWIFGWDYAHSGDYTTASLGVLSFMPFNDDWGALSGKKWTVDEIKEDIKSFIHYIQDIEDDADKFFEYLHE